MRDFFSPLCRACQWNNFNLTYVFKVVHTIHNWRVLMVMPKRGHKKVMIYVPPEFWEEVKREAKQRKATLGDLVVEAFNCRMRLIKK